MEAPEQQDKATTVAVVERITAALAGQAMSPRRSLAQVLHTHLAGLVGHLDKAHPVLQILVMAEVAQAIQAKEALAQVAADQEQKS